MKTYQTKADTDVLKFIKRYFQKYGCAPTHVVIANEFGLSRQWATYRIDRLKKFDRLLSTKRFGLYVVNSD